MFTRFAIARNVPDTCLAESGVMQGAPEPDRRRRRESTDESGTVDPFVDGHDSAFAVVTTLAAGRVEYGAIQRHRAGILTLAWRYRVSHTGRWFTCGELIPSGALYAVVGWDGQQIGHVDSVREGLQAVRRFYARTAIGSAEPAASLRY